MNSMQYHKICYYHYQIQKITYWSQELVIFWKWDWVVPNLRHHDLLRRKSSPSRLTIDTPRAFNNPSIQLSSSILRRNIAVQVWRSLPPPSPCTSWSQSRSSFDHRRSNYFFFASRQPRRSSKIHNRPSGVQKSNCGFVDVHPTRCQGFGTGVVGLGKRCRVSDDGWRMTVMGFRWVCTSSVTTIVGRVCVKRFWGVDRERRFGGRRMSWSGTVIGK